MPILYYHPLSSFCHKALIALYVLDVAFERRVIDLGNPADRQALGALWAPTKFPVLYDEQRQLALPESSIIIEYLDRHFAGQHRLIPLDPDTALEMRLWDRFFDLHMQLPQQQIVLDRIMGSKGDMGPQRAALSLAYTMLEERMAERTWAAGEQFSMADCAAAPALFYAHTLAPIADGTNTMAYFNRLMKHPSVQRVIREAQPYFGMYPFKEAIAPRFLGPDV
ncbi:MAG: glutathione S-transferase family protein [Pseudomonadota bacterium]